MGVMKRLNLSGRSAFSGRAGSLEARIAFNSAGLKSIVDKHGKEWLRVFGGYTRKVAKNSIQKKGRAKGKAPKQYTKRGHESKAYLRWAQEVRERKPSTPPAPPYTHTGFLRGSIEYKVDYASKSAVIGPYRAAWLNTLHEFGGYRKVSRVPRKPNWVLSTGGHGPVDVLGTTVRVGKLHTEAQVKRANRLAAVVDRARTQTEIIQSTRKYPARPFMQPALEDTIDRMPTIIRTHQIKDK